MKKTKQEIERIIPKEWGEGPEAWWVHYTDNTTDYIGIDESKRHNLTDELSVYQYLSKGLR